jgi:hypothetical protein
MLQLNVEAPTPLVVPPSLRLVTAILSAAASAGYPEEVAGGAHRFGQVERKTLSRRKCRCRRGCCSSRVTSAREHYELAGFAEKREGAFIPDEWDEAAYLKANPDVAEVSGACSKAHVLVFSTLSGLVGSMPLHKVPYIPF